MEHSEHEEGSDGCTSEDQTHGQWRNNVHPTCFFPKPNERLWIKFGAEEVVLGMYFDPRLHIYNV